MKTTLHAKYFENRLSETFTNMRARSIEEQIMISYDVLLECNDLEISSNFNHFVSKLI